jgi:hypothetical protein
MYWNSWVPDFFDAFLADAMPGLTSLGLKRKVGATFVMPLGVTTTGWLGLNHAYYPTEDRIGLTVIVGVRDEEVERDLEELVRGSGYAPPKAATVRVNIDQLKPTPDKRILFGRSGVDAAARDLITQLRTWAVPFWRSTIERQQILEGLERYGSEAEKQLKTPILFLRLGDSTRARSALDSTLDAVSRRGDDSARGIGYVARAFQKRHFTTHS